MRLRLTGHSWRRRRRRGRIRVVTVMQTLHSVMFCLHLPVIRAPVASSQESVPSSHSPAPGPSAPLPLTPRIGRPGHQRRPPPSFPPRERPPCRESGNGQTSRSTMLRTRTSSPTRRPWRTPSAWPQVNSPAASTLPPWNACRPGSSRRRVSPRAAHRHLQRQAALDRGDRCRQPVRPGPRRAAWIPAPPPVSSHRDPVAGLGLASAGQHPGDDRSSRLRRRRRWKSSPARWRTGRRQLKRRNWSEPLRPGSCTC